MLETLILLGLLGVLLAKRKPTKRSMGRYIRGRVDEELSLGTLAGKTLVSTTFDETVQERTLVTSIVATWSMRSMTAVSNSGPVVFGVAHGDYSDAEIEEVIENAGSWDEGNKVSQEISKRQVRTIGVFRAEEGDAGTGVVVINHGRPVKTRLNWILNQGVRLKIWGYNMGTAALQTTVPIIAAEGHANLFPR